MPHRLQQEVGEAEGKIKCRIAVTRRLGIEKYRTIRTAQNILGADIALHQGNARFCDVGRHLADGVCKVWVSPGSEKQVGLKTKRMELSVIGKHVGDLDVPSRCGMYFCQ